jgi:hypothetical protein
MTKRKPKPKPDDNEANDAHDKLHMFAAYVAGPVLIGLADFHGLCLQCLGRAVIDEIEAALAHLEAHDAKDIIGHPEGSA